MTVAVDTNIILRLALKDNREQLADVERFIERSKARGEPILIGPIVLSEIAWTLARRGSKADLIRTVEALLDAPPFQLFDATLVQRALVDFRATKADFVDCLIGRMNQAASCRTTVSFDRAALELDAFSHPSELE